MKQLTVLRHAKSSWEEPGRDDFDRALNERGRHAARRIGHEMMHRNMSFDFALASPAARVRETLDGIAEAYGALQFPLRFDPNVYLAGAAALLELIHSLPEDAGRVLLVGHNPGLQRLILKLSKDDVRLPTAALALINLDVAQWRDVSPGSGRLRELILPKELD